MRLLLRSGFLVLAVALAAGAACGGNVIIDGSGGTTTGSSSSSSSSTTTGATSSSTTSSSTSSTSSTSSATSSTSSTGGVGACTDGMDLTALGVNVTWPTEVNCAVQNPLNLGATQMCLQGMLGFLSGCAACIADDIVCAEKSCLNVCQSGPTSPACISCRQATCATSFTACSGLPRQTGATTGASLSGGGPTQTPWVRGLPAAYFTTTDAYNAYEEYDVCACETCAQCQVDYCGGSLAADPMCVACLVAQCTAGIAPFCQSN